MLIYLRLVLALYLGAIMIVERVRKNSFSNISSLNFFLRLSG